MRGFADAMDLQYVAVEPEHAPSFTSNGYLRVNGDGEAVLLQNPNRMGQAWVNYAVRRAATEAEALDYVTGPGFDPRREVVIRQELQATYPASVTHPTTPARACGARSHRARGRRGTTASGPLVVSEAHFRAGLPRWTASRRRFWMQTPCCVGSSSMRARTRALRVSSLVRAAGNVAQPERARRLVLYPDCADAAQETCDRPGATCWLSRSRRAGVQRGERLDETAHGGSFSDVQRGRQHRLVPSPVARHPGALSRRERRIRRCPRCGVLISDSLRQRNRS